MSRISTRQLAQLCRRVGQSLRAGLDMRTIWEKESLRGSPRARGRMLVVSQRVASGGGVGDALAAVGGYFPPFVCAMANVGEQTGHLDETFLKLADHYDQTLKLRRIFLIGIAWPAIELTIALIGLPLMFLFAMSLFPQLRELDIFGLGITGSQSILLYFVALALVVGLMGVAAMFMRRIWGTGPVAKYVLMIPVLGACLRLIALSRFAWSLSLANQAGMDIRNAMRLSLLSMQNGYFASQGEWIDRRLLAGEEVHVTLRSTRQYPEEFLAALETGEVTGQIAESMALVANDYQARVQALSRVLTLIGSLLVWGCVAAILIFIIFSLVIRYANFITDMASPQ